MTRSGDAMDQRSTKFAFLKRYAKLEAIAGNAERDWRRNPVGALMQLRLFDELLAAQITTRVLCSAPQGLIARRLYCCAYRALETQGQPKAPL